MSMAIWKLLHFLLHLTLTPPCYTLCYPTLLCTLLDKQVHQALFFLSFLHIATCDTIVTNHFATHLCYTPLLHTFVTHLCYTPLLHAFVTCLRYLCYTMSCMSRTFVTCACYASLFKIISQCFMPYATCHWFVTFVTH